MGSKFSPQFYRMSYIISYVILLVLISDQSLGGVPPKQCRTGNPSASSSNCESFQLPLRAGNPSASSSNWESFSFLVELGILSASSSSRESFSVLVELGILQLPRRTGNPSASSVAGCRFLSVIVNCCLKSLMFENCKDGGLCCMGWLFCRVILYEIFGLFFLYESNLPGPLKNRLRWFSAKPFLAVSQ